DLVVALHIDRDDLRRAPVGEPQTALVPARLLAERDPLHEHVRLSHRRPLVLKRIPAPKTVLDDTVLASRTVPSSTLGSQHGEREPMRRDLGASSLAEAGEERRSVRKRNAILTAARTVFLRSGYLGTSMDEIAALAAVSKQTVYKQFADKKRLFTEIVIM